MLPCGSHTWLCTYPPSLPPPKQVVLPQLCFDDADAELWEEDPQEFVRKGYDVLEDMMNPRTSASNFVTTIASKRAKPHLTPLMARLVEVMNTYLMAGAVCCWCVLLWLCCGCVVVWPWRVCVCVLWCGGLLC